MTNAWVDWFHIFMTHVNTNNVVMWVIQPNNADWDCFKTLTSQEILKIRNPLLEEHCAFSEVIHLFQQVGCVRNKLPFHTFLQNPKSSLWTLTIPTSERPGRPIIIDRSQRSQGKINALNNIDCSLKRPVFASRSFVVCVWGQRSSDQDDH